LLAPGRKPLSYGRLAAMVGENLGQLRRRGIGSRDCLAIVLPNGPVMAAVLLTAMATGRAAPLNPDYTAGEYDFYLSDLKAAALALEAGRLHPSRTAARARGIPVIELYSEVTGEAGSFRLVSDFSGPASRDGLPQPDDIALLLHTSGTTSRPKLVPLTQSNLYYSAHNIRQGLGLSPDDRCLNVMPLFHVHGLVASLLASLAAGASVVCSPGFKVNEFFNWLKDFGPTWYTAVPTIHQAVLAAASGAPGVIRAHRLRFIRSCSAVLPAAVMSGLESLFRVPVIEAYGMTEASHEMASNPLPPGRRKPGSVGLPAGGLEMTILDSAGGPAASGDPGEVGVRGRTITSGYLGNREANARNFFKGWLRTGDRGHFDADGYLYLDGRLKELINRGGEKISPCEVEDAVLAHPGVAEAAVFALPDPRLGENVAAAVVPKPGVQVSEKEIQSLVAGKLAYFKVPSRVILTGAIPKGPTGKLQRVGLGEKLGLSPPAKPWPGRVEPAGGGDEPETATEKRLARLMGKFLGNEKIGRDDNFFESGGDSLQAAAFLAEVETRFGLELPLSSFVLSATARHLADLIESRMAPAQSTLVPIKPGGTRPPFFCVHPHDGRVTLFYPLAERLEKDQPLYAFQASSAEGVRPRPGGIEGLAGAYVRAMQAFRPGGPYLIGGYCFGALVALEMARILREQGEEVSLLALMDSYAPGGPEPSFRGVAAGAFFALLDRCRRIRPLLEYVSHFPSGQRKQYLTSLLRTQLGELRSAVRGLRSQSRSLYSLPGRETDSDWDYRPVPYPGSAVLFRPTRQPLGFRRNPDMGWGRFISGRLDVEPVPGYPRGLIFKPHCFLLADRLNARLRRALRKS
jgi:acyl-CoA synthetase (AMP-forming)/AMP-acid ligase II/thioesterase domain-containing protein/acyl carrier protein